MRRALFLFLALLTVAAAPHKPATHHSAKTAHPAATDWTTVFAATPDGGIRMGNPTAKVKLVEYFSYTCPHCGAFAGEAFGPITSKYVKTGDVSFEMRSALRDRLDYVAARVARCGGTQHYFSNTEAIFAGQSDWEQKAIDWDNDHHADFRGDGAVAAMHALATSSGLEAIVGKNGVTPAQIGRCLSDKTTQPILEKTTDDAWNVRKISGTPAFFINDSYQDNVFGWTQLEPRIRDALKG